MVDDPLVRFDAVHVVSDLHMGGERGFQILREAARLAGYVRRLTALRPDDEVCLVLDGDVFDTLAEEMEGYAAVNDALAVVGRIVADATFAPVWAALAGFVRTPRRRLVFVIGNHDIEIALPPVQRLLLERLAGDDAAARGRVLFSTMGAGFACRVGGTRVFCIHGNEVDAWNYLRYEDLARAARRVNAGQRLEPGEWRPNAGTRMVKDVMNAAKRRYAWIDLLKPENSAAVGTLLVIDPGQVARLGEIAGVVGEKARGDQEFAGRLGATDRFIERAAGRAPPPLETLLGKHLLAARAPAMAEEMLRTAERQLKTPGAADAGNEGTLGTGQLVWDRLTGWITGVDKAEALRRALRDWLRGDASFDIGERDETCSAVLATVGPAVDIVVTGHTHLARAIDLGGGRFYFNTGTWIRLMQFTDAMLDSKSSFLPLWEVLQDGTMARIDTAVVAGQPLLLDRTSAVEVASEGGRVVGRLLEVKGDGSATPLTVRQFERG